MNIILANVLLLDMITSYCIQHLGLKYFRLRIMDMQASAAKNKTCVKQ